MIFNPFAAIGRASMAAFSEIGRLAIFTGRVLLACLTPPIYLREFFSQCMKVGFFSLPVVGMTAVFIGASLALNIYVGTQFGAEQIVPTISVIGITRELGPVLAALMLAGRVSAGVAAEIGAMKVTEQIDALHTLSAKPERYLYAPRVLAATLTMPILVLIADIVGLMGAWMICVAALDFSGPTFLRNVWQENIYENVSVGLIKAAGFGMIIAIMGCYQGSNSKGGAGGVGRAATLAVVGAAVLILASNYVMTSMFADT